ncbi:hypothetical protein [Marinobacter sp.]|uniref:hypothetical protein n=1 Tax=Marinobacter sp. TaxID=50741 RepID=UPI003A9035AC
MSTSVVRLAGSSKTVFTAWQSLRKSVDKTSVRQSEQESCAVCQPTSRGRNSG